MKKLFNTLYVTTEGAALRKDGENLVAEIEGAERARVPLHMLASAVTFHYRGISSSVLVTSSPSLRRSRPPQHGQHVAAGMDDALARQMLRYAGGLQRKVNLLTLEGADRKQVLRAQKGTA